MILPQTVEGILRRLESCGYEAYIVGGCVRDVLLGKRPTDWDICTSAHPKEMMKVFSGCRLIPTGLKHGTLSLVIDGVSYELTTYRSDGCYEDGRHPRLVSFVSDLEEDLLRRDFTMNAMAYHPDIGFRDPFDGRKDLSKRIIRTVGDPKQRFAEDYLRMMRGVRFSAVLGFELEEKTFLAIIQAAKGIECISKERIREELMKIIRSSRAAQGVRMLQSCGLLQYILPQLVACIGVSQNHPRHNKDVYEHILEVVEHLEEEDEMVKLAGLFHDIGKPEVKTTDKDGVDHFYRHEEVGRKISMEILRKMKFSNEEINQITALIQHHGYQPLLEKNAIKRFINKVGVDRVRKLLVLQRADRIAHISDNGQDSYGEELQKQVEAILLSKEPLTMKDLKLNGKDLIQIGYPQGQTIGEIKAFLLRHILMYPQDNERETLVQIAKNHFVK